MRGVRRLIIGQLYASAPRDLPGQRPLPAVFGRASGLRCYHGTDEAEALLVELRDENGRPWHGGSSYFNLRALEFVH